MTVGDVACVLSGGGAKAAAHVGAMRALDERSGRAVRFVATSMGAVVAASFACGLGPDEVRRRLADAASVRVARPAWSLLKGPYAECLLAPGPLREVIERLVPAECFPELAVPLTVTAVDVETGALTLFGAGGRADVPLRAALYASCALPIYLPPGRVAGRAYMDGGVRAVLPLEVAASFEPPSIFAVHVGPTFDAERQAPSRTVPPLLRAHDAAVHALMAAQAERDIAAARRGTIPVTVVRPRQSRRATFARADSTHYVEEGYRAAREALGGTT